jgi:hypothetical protein
LTTSSTSWNGEIYPFALCFPPLTGADYEALKADMARRGQVWPITLNYHGCLVDGLARLQICEELGLKPTFAALPAGADLERYIMSLNGCRLTAEERAEAAARLAGVPPRALVRR